MLTLPKLPTGLSGIYLIQNKVTKCFYVGSSKCIRTRLTQHKNDLKNNRHKNSRLMADYLNNGADGFVVKVLVRCDTNELLVYEQRMLDLLKRHYPTYHAGNYVVCPATNTKRPDYHNSGKRTLDEWRHKAHQARRDSLKNNPEIREKVSNAGRKSMARLRANMDTETKRKQRAAEAQARPELKLLRRQQMLDRYANGWKPEHEPTNKQKVIHLPTGKVFCSLTEAAGFAGVKVSSMHRWVHGRIYKGSRVGFNKDWSLYETPNV